MQHLVNNNVWPGICKIFHILAYRFDQEPSLGGALANYDGKGTRTSPNIRFNEQKNSSARAFEMLVHFIVKQRHEMTKFCVFWRVNYVNDDG